jgi:DNA-binding NtrC family response regulator
MASLEARRPPPTPPQTPTLERNRPNGRLLESTEGSVSCQGPPAVAEATAHARTEAAGTERALLVHRSSVMRDVCMLIKRVASRDWPVLITGETGTGKELAARQVHLGSKRNSGTFLALNCGAFEENLLENELFGHERGAFTGADRTRIGLLEVAANGTVFLDEVAEMSLTMQAKLLRVLQDGTFRRVGGNVELRTSARIVCATNKDLLEMVQRGLFRADLYYRIAALLVHIPPLRERLGDVPLLISHILPTLASETESARTLTQEALTALCRYAWPGNVRELENVLKQAFVLSDGAEIGLRHLQIPQWASNEPAVMHGSDRAITVDRAGPDTPDTVVRRVRDWTDGPKPYWFDDGRAVEMIAESSPNGVLPNRVTLARLVGGKTSTVAEHYLKYCRYFGLEPKSLRPPSRYRRG